jgi:hypothetical protein
MAPAVTRVSRSQLSAAAAAIARGFQDNEIWTWMIPNERRRARLLPRYYRVAIRHIFDPRGGAWATDDAGGGAVGAAGTLAAQRTRGAPRHARAAAGDRAPRRTSG